MADRDDDKSSNRGFAAKDKEKREAIARKGGEASHRNDDTKSSGSSSAHTASEGGPCRDESGRFTECAEDEKGSGGSSIKERTASKGGEHSHGGHGGSSSGSRSSRD